MFVIFCRIFQFIFNVVVRFLPWRKAARVEGAACIGKIPELLNKHKLKMPMLVTDEGLVKAGIAQRIIDVLAKARFPYLVFTGVEPNPSVNTVDKIYELYTVQKCDCFIALGGGSAMDAAKGAAARVARHGKSVEQLSGLLKVIKKLPPFIAVPTTAGTGSETTIAALITDTETCHKHAIMDICLIPRYAILDPELTMGLPPAITAVTGMDALTHAIEAYLCWTYNTGESKRFALDAVKIIFANIEKVYDYGNNIEARQAMQIASYKAGFAFTRAGVGNIHAIAHALGGLYKIPHGLAVAVILPKVLEDYGNKVHKKLAALADIAGLVAKTDKKTNAEKARIFIDAIYSMNERMGIPKGLDCIKDDDIPKMIKWAEKECNPLYPVPVIYNEKRFRKMIEEIRIGN